MSPLAHPRHIKVEITDVTTQTTCKGIPLKCKSRIRTVTFAGIDCCVTFHAQSLFVCISGNFNLLHICSSANVTQELKLWLSILFQAPLPWALAQALLLGRLTPPGPPRPHGPPPSDPARPARTLSLSRPSLRRYVWPRLRPLFTFTA